MHFFFPGNFKIVSRDLRYSVSLKEEEIFITYIWFLCMCIDGGVIGGGGKDVNFDSKIYKNLSKA